MKGLLRKIRQMRLGMMVVMMELHLQTIMELRQRMREGMMGELMSLERLRSLELRGQHLHY
jgi:hypothetical protein